MTIALPELRQRVAALLASHPPATTEPLDFLRARYDAGLAWVSYPEGHGGLGGVGSFFGHDGLDLRVPLHEVGGLLRQLPLAGHLSADLGMQ